MRTVKIGINQRWGCVTQADVEDFYSSCFAFICEPLPFLSRISEHNVALIVYSLMPGTSAKQVTSCYLLRYSGYKQSFPHQPLVSLSLSLSKTKICSFFWLPSWTVGLGSILETFSVFPWTCLGFIAIGTWTCPSFSPPIILAKNCLESKNDIKKK